ncbi:serine/threonine protein kinase [Corynebacterium sp. 13CS0277]|uniref:PASTA domain-containing protein n=1 Tax=Corynebacterium sp. 13CS0277 TaxID=2071994 RepID=UPI000D026208|nr:PASTA domain-containing protein [Corynebacterium sp. 13CS0277]PRQ11140.1 serine/threonine protein kinase [Corynebacterium sp. 13CS0277]
MAHLKPGDVLDSRYRIDYPIARGGMSTVYRCIDLRLGRAVAAKVLDDAYAHDQLFRTRFRREARSMAQLSHPCLVNVYDTSSTGPDVFLVMELITGGTLRELLAERGPMPPHAATAVLRQALTGLSVAHRAGMIHRDIKPDNVLINSDHQVKLADFGLVRGINRADAPEDTIMGTAAYLAPEQVRGEKLTQAADVYAAGVVLFELLTGVTPFTGADPKEVAYARLRQDVPAPSTMIEGVPPAFDELVRTATAADPADRYPTADEFLAALDAAADQLGLPAFVVPVPRNAAAHRASAVPTEQTDLITGVIAGPGASAAAPTEVLTTALPTPPSRPPRRGGDAADEEATTVLPSGGQTAALETSVLPQVDDAGSGDAEPMLPGMAGATAALPTPQATAQYPQATDYPPAPHPGVQYAGVQQPLFPGGEVATGDEEELEELVDAPVVRNRSGWKTALWAAVVVAMLAAIALGGWWFGSGRYGDIPVVIGMPPEQARSTVTGAGFTLAEEHTYSDEVPAGQVIGSTPKAGERLPKGRTVTLELSLGQPVVPEIPASRTLEDFDRDASGRTLNVLTGTEEYSDTVPHGQVVSAEPAAGTQVGVGSTVTVHLSKGPAPVAVPQVHDLSVEKATELLEKNGLRVGSRIEEFDEHTRGGMVAGTRPEAGHELLRGSTVDLVVSTALEVPQLAGMSEKEARAALAEAGLTVGQIVTEDQPAKANTVLRSYPEAGQLVNPAYTEVDLVLPAKVTVPKVTGKKVEEATKILKAAGFQVDTTASRGARVVSTHPKAGSAQKPGARVSLKTLG